MARKKQLSREQVVEAISRCFIKHGMAPTVDELRRVLKVGSTRTALRYLQWLEESGDIERWPGARGLRLLRTPDQGVETRSVPVVGEAPAGPVMLAEENLQGWVRLPAASLRPRNAKFFLLRVRGDSMNRARIDGARIEDGDLVLVRQQPAADPGSVVVALTDGEATIKRLVRGPNYFLLKPESTNPEHQPILVNRDFRVHGVVTHVLKKGTSIVGLR